MSVAIYPSSLADFPTMPIAYQIQITPNGSNSFARPHPVDHRRLVAFLARLLSNALPTVSELAIVFRVPEYLIYDAAVDAEDLGLVELYPDHPPGPAVCLSPLTAQRFNLKIKADYARSSIRYRWVRLDQPEPTIRRKPHPQSRTVLETDLGHSLDQIGDCSNDASRLIDAIDAYRRGRIGLDALQSAVSAGAYLTDGGLPWEGTDPDADLSTRDPSPRDPCQVCHGQPRTSLSYCPRCDRTGIDDLLPACPARLPAGPKRRGPGRLKAPSVPLTRKEIRRNRHAG